MIDITINQGKRGTPQATLYRVKAPAVPQVGNHVSSDKDGFSGYVDTVSYWWDEKGKLIIEVRIF